MTKQISLVFKVGGLMLVLLLAGTASAGWSDVPSLVTPSVCPASVPGCNTPLNVSSSAQIKGGGLTLGGGLASGFKIPVATSGTTLFGTLAAGSYTYRYTVVINGVEFGSAPSNIVSIPAPRQITVSLPGYNGVTIFAPAGATGLKIYRKKEGVDPTWKLLASNLPVMSAFYPDTGTAVSTTIFPASAESSTVINNQLYYSAGSPGEGNVLTSDAYGKATWKPSSGVGDQLWQISTTNSSNIYNRNVGNVGIGTAAPTAKLDVAGVGLGSPVLQVSSTYGNYAYLAINGAGGAFSGMSNGIYAQATGNNLDNAATVGMVTDGTSKETYGGKFIGANFGTYTRGTVALYATDQAHALLQVNAVPTRGNRVPLSLVGNTKQWAGYFDGDVNINGGLYINNVQFSNQISISTSFTKIFDKTRWIRVEAFCPSGAQRMSCSSYQSDCEEEDCGNHGVKPITTNGLQGCQGWFDNDSTTEDRVDAYCLR